jgi:PAS domain S-box-containing protein
VLAFVLVTLAILIAVTVIFGWQFDNDFLMKFGVGKNPMNPTTALVILLLNFGFLFFFGKKERVLLASVVTGCALIICAGRLFSFIFAFDLPVDLLLFPSKLLAQSLSKSYDRMALNTAVAGVLGSGALFLAIAKRITAAHWIAVAMMLLSMFSVFGFLYGVPEFSQGLRQIPMASHTALAFLFFWTALIIVRPTEGIAAELTSSQEGSTLSKYLIPLILILPVAIGYARMWAHWQGKISVELGVTLIVFTITVLFTFIVAAIIYILNKSGTERLQYYQELAALSDAREAANEEMAALNEEVTAANEELLVNNERLVELNDQLDLVNRTIARQKDEQLNRVLDISSDVIWSIDLTKKGESYISRSAEKIFGFASDELMNKPLFWADFVFPEDKEIVQDEIIQLKIKGVCECIFRIQKSNGGVRWVRCRPRLLFGSDGKPIRETGILSDITEQHIAEEQLREYQTNLDIIFTNTREGFLLLDHSGRVILFNTSYEQFLLKATGKFPVKGALLWETTIKARQQIARDLFHRALDGEVIQTDAEFKIGDEIIIHSLRYEPVRIGGKISHVCIISTDVTTERGSEAELHRSEANLQAIFNNTLDHFTLIDIDFTILAFNKNNAVSVKFFTGKDLRVGANMLETIQPERQPAFLKALEKASTQGSFRYNASFAKDAGIHWFEVSINAVRDENGKAIGYCITSHDSTEARLAQSEIVRLNHSLTDFQNAIYNSSIVSRADKTGLITFVNENFLKISGYPFEELIGQNHRVINSGFHPKSFWIAMWKTISSGKTWRADVKNRAKDGRFYWVDTFIMPFMNDRGEVLEYLSIRNDITDRKHSEEEIKKINERYELLSRATNDAIWDWDISTGRVSWNHALESIFYYSADEINFALDFWKDNIHPEDRENVLTSIERAFNRRNANWTASYRFRCSNGKYKNIYDRGYIIFDSNGPVRMIGGMQDISDRVMAMEEIEKLSIVASKTENAVMITDSEEKIEWVNESLIRMTGYSFQELSGRKPNLFQGAETDQDVVRKMREKIRRQESFSGELINYSKDGRKYWLRLDITPVFKDGEVLKNFIAIQSDITEQKEFEARITAIAEEMASLIENANVPIFGIDKEGRINEWNKVCAELSGFSRQQVLGKGWIEEMVEFKYRAVCHQMINSVLLGNAISNFELPLATPQRNLVLLLSASPRKDIRHNITGAIVVAQDITELIEYRQNLEKIVQDRTRDLNTALQKEKELVQMKSKFVSIASHEFRTPLTTISLATGFLKKFNHKLDQGEMVARLQNIEKQVEHMTHLLDDVLTIGKSEAGKIPVNASTINLKEFFERIVSEIVQNTNRTHVINLEFSLMRNEIESDEKLLRNIVINLLTNGIKFSPDAGEIELRVRTNLQEVDIRVTDYGIGIPPNDVDKLFEPFYRASNVNAFAGTGLGLSIIRKAIDLLEGSINVTSTLGKGTTIDIVLPIKDT